MPTWLLVLLLIGQIFIGFFAAMAMMFMACAENAPTLSKPLDRVLVSLWVTFIIALAVSVGIIIVGLINAAQYSHALLIPWPLLLLIAIIWNWVSLRAKRDKDKKKRLT
ncbi:hypothetical protein MHM95_04785 [Pseudoalteromonas sp. CnMc7-15]|uniref:hypothetical protein n=1 Tax=unclassified Pseudoalteromonas TaxID=194690 RepID=UPI001EF6FA7B|nr:hypothetical protein [Pseudoalteromonas sp. CnMc7-15]MCG7565596.1 hypothetical protein [Pseudoalteromonas sp. CnMc7-15]